MRPLLKGKMGKLMNRLFPIMIIIMVLTLAGFAQFNDASMGTVQPEKLSFEYQPQIETGEFLDQNTTAHFKDYLNTIKVNVDGFDTEAHCMAQAIYFEARSEPIEGQLAVAQVVMNRVGDRRYPNSVCAVVFQNERWKHRCQFSFACDGKSDRPRETRAWNLATKISYVAIADRWQDITKSATHYHADYVQPYWSKSMEKTVVYGQHLFYSTKRPSP
jgi:spore germination cell wall hydrolase CwlJ-like protein